MPRDAYGFLSLRVADLWKSEASDGLRKLLAARKPDFAKDVEQAVGVTMADIERGTVVGKGPKFSSVGILSTTKPLGRARVLKTLGLEKTEEKKLQGKTYYEEDGPGVVVFFPSDSILLISPFAVEKVEKGAGRKYLDWTMQKRTDGALGVPLGLAAKKHHVTVALVPGFIKEMMGDVPAEFKALEPLLQANHAAAALDFGKEGLRVETHFAFASDEQAQEGEKAAKAGLEMAKKTVAALIKKTTNEPAKDPAARKAQELQLSFLKLLEPASKNAAVKRQGVGVTVSLQIQGKESANVLDLLAQYYLAAQ